MKTIKITKQDGEFRTLTTPECDAFWNSVFGETEEVEFEYMAFCDTLAHTGRPEELTTFSDCFGVRNLPGGIDVRVEGMSSTTSSEYSLRPEDVDQYLLVVTIPADALEQEELFLSANGRGRHILTEDKYEDEVKEKHYCTEDYVRNDAEIIREISDTLPGLDLRGSARFIFNKVVDYVWNGERLDKLDDMIDSIPQRADRESWIDAQTFLMYEQILLEGEKE